jgi:hypothetical protein
MKYTLFHYESPEPERVRITVPAIGLRYARCGTRVNCRLFGRLAYVAAEDRAYGRLGPLVFARINHHASLRVGPVFVYRRVAGIRTLRPSTRFF